MEIRLLQSFVAIAREGSITRAAELLNITQPALSRQLAQLERELDCHLFLRGGKRMVLTEEGLLLQRRAQDILALVSMAEEELAPDALRLAGSISIGTGALASTSWLIRCLAQFGSEHPDVRFHLFTGVADQVSERLESGLLDFGLFLEPVDKTEYEFMRLPIPERWVAVMRSDDELAFTEAITPADLKSRPLILPSRAGVQSELAQWFGRGFDALDRRFTVNLGSVAALMVEQNLGVLLCVEGAALSWSRERIAVRPLHPAIESSAVIAWKRGVSHTRAVRALIDHMRELLDQA